MTTTQTRPTSARDLTLIVDGESLAYAQTCSAQYVHNESELDSDFAVVHDPNLPLRRLIEVAHLLAGGADDDGREPVVTAYYVRTPGNEAFADTDFPCPVEWPTGQDLEALGIVGHVVGRDRPTRGDLYDKPRTAAEFIFLLAEADAGANDVLIVSQADPRGSLTFGLREIRTLPDGAARRVMAACFARLPERFGRSGRSQCARMPAKRPWLRIENRPDSYGWEFVCACEQAATTKPFAKSDIEVFDLIDDLGLPFLYTEDFDELQCNCNRTQDDYDFYPCDACYQGGGLDDTCRPDLERKRDRTSARFIERFQRRASSKPPMRTRTTPRLSPRTDQPLTVLIDFENIEWCLRRLWDEEDLNPSQRPDWTLVDAFFCDQAGEGALHVKGFLQDSGPKVRRFAEYLRKNFDFDVELLEVEYDSTYPRGRRPVVDWAIKDELDALYDRHCDVIVVSNDGGFLRPLEGLRDRGVDQERRFIVLGLNHEMSGDYRRADWIETLDLEYDVDVFQRRLPPRDQLRRIAQASFVD